MVEEMLQEVGGRRLIVVDGVEVIEGVETIEGKGVWVVDNLLGLIVSEAEERKCRWPAIGSQGKIRFKVEETLGIQEFFLVDSHWK